jgi:hypothetical protein
MASAASLGAALVPRHRPKRRQGRALFPVAKTGPSEPAKVKKATKRSAECLRVIDFADLIAHLGTLTRNTVRVPPRQSHRFTTSVYTNRPAGGCLQAPRPRSRACPADQKPDPDILSSDQ